MKRMLATASVLALMTVAAQAQSKPQVPAEPTLGVGGTLCSQYLRAARSSDILYHQASSWVLGYVSGLSEAMRSPGQASALDGVSGDQVLRSATRYCEANLTSTIANAVNVWYAATPKPAAAPQQAEAKKDDDNWVRLNLTAPARKPLLDRR